MVYILCASYKCCHCCMCPVHESDSNRAEHHLTVYSRPADVSPSATNEFQGHTFLQGEDKGIGAHKKAGHTDIKQSLERQVILP